MTLVRSPPVADHDADLAAPEVVWTIVVGGGSGARFGSLKQFAHLNGRSVLDWSCATAEAMSDGVVVVLPPAETGRRAGAVAGGATRAESVRRGLAAVPREATIICVHDAVRPFASPELYRSVIDAVRSGAPAAIPGLAVTDTIKQVDAARAVVATPPRESLVAVQTPQAFRADVLRRAHATTAEGTDDAAIAEAIGATIQVVDGDPANLKIT